MAYKIFITEDDKVTSHFIKHALEKAGYQVAGQASNAEYAIEQILATQPDLVLMDISLPGETDGIMAASLVKEKANIPVIFATSVADEATVQRIIQSDPNGYVLKPIVPVQLYTTIETAMYRDKLEKQLTALNEDLESKVRERTQELAENNKQLQAEVRRRKETEENLKQALSKEKELNELKTRIVSIVSHEFKTPLTTILSSTQLINFHLRQHSEPDKIERHTQTIIKSINNLTNILNDTLFLSKTESNKLKMDPTDIPLRELVLEIWEDLQMSHGKEYRLSLKVEPEDEIRVHQDLKLIRQVLQNLIQNAMKYSPNSFDIFVSIKRVKDRVRISVLDYGVGIPRKDYKLLFEMFHRASNVENIEGTGVGLAIVKKSMQMIEGNVHFNSKEGEGSEFIIDFPVHHQSND